MVRDRINWDASGNSSGLDSSANISQSSANDHSSGRTNTDLLVAACSAVAVQQRRDSSADLFSNDRGQGDNRPKFKHGKKGKKWHRNTLR